MLVAAGAATGFVLRRYVGHGVGRTVLLLGLAALILAVAVLGLTVAGRGPWGTWTASLVAVVLFAIAALAFPFGLTVSVGRPWFRRRRR